MMRAFAAFNFFFVFVTITISVSVIMDYYPQLYQNNLTLIRGMLVARGISKLSLEIPILYQFIVCFFFFVNKRLEGENNLNKTHRFIIIWTVTLGILRLYIALCISTLAGFY